MDDVDAMTDLTALPTEALVEIREALKYNPDQPRDERGRWTAGDSTGAAWADAKARIAAHGPGNCYPAAATLAMRADELGLRNARVVHATCTGQGAIAGKAFGHAWVEADGPHGIRVAYDYSGGKEVELPASFYRQLGEARGVREYTPREAMVQMVKTGHYGPWA